MNGDFSYELGGGGAVTNDTGPYDFELGGGQAIDRSGPITVTVPANVSTADIAQDVANNPNGETDPGFHSTSEVVRDHASGVVQTPAPDVEAAGSADFSKIFGAVKDVANAAIEITGNVAQIVPSLRPTLQKIGIVLPNQQVQPQKPALPSWAVPAAIVGGAWLLLRAAPR